MNFLKMIVASFLIIGSIHANQGPEKLRLLRGTFVHISVGCATHCDWIIKEYNPELIQVEQKESTTFPHRIGARLISFRIASIEGAPSQPHSTSVVLECINRVTGQPCGQKVYEINIWSDLVTAETSLLLVNPLKYLWRKIMRKSVSFGKNYYVPYRPNA